MVGPRTYDLALFEELNEQFRDTPLVPKPPQIDHRSLAETATRKLSTIGRYIDPAGKVVLDLGAGRGWLSRTLIVNGGARAVIGVDVREYPEWEDHRALDGLELIVADLATDNAIPAESVDAIVSTAVLEHVERPLPMLEALHRILRVGGEAWLHFNLHRGRKASHKYREVFFPWPHLLFDDDVCRAFYEKHLNVRTGFSWVNRLTMAHYLQACGELGFEVSLLRRHSTPLEDDLAFYLEFEDRLGRYPALDLETEFLTLVLRKLDSPSGIVPPLGYLERQRRFDAAIVDARAEVAGLPAV